MSVVPSRPDGLWTTLDDAYTEGAGPVLKGTLVWAGQDRIARILRTAFKRSLTLTLAAVASD
jgi:hypothetical protein